MSWEWNSFYIMPSQPPIKQNYWYKMKFNAIQHSGDTACHITECRIPRDELALLASCCLLSSHLHTHHCTLKYSLTEMVITGTYWNQMLKLTSTQPYENFYIIKYIYSDIGYIQKILQILQLLIKFLTVSTGTISEDSYMVVPACNNLSS